MEVYYYEDDRGVQVTSKRFIVIEKGHEVTFSMANITSVEMYIKPAKYWLAIILILLYHKSLLTV